MHRPFDGLKPNNLNKVLQKLIVIVENPKKFQIFFHSMPSKYERYSPLDVPTYAFGQGIMRFYCIIPSYRPFCTIFSQLPKKAATKHFVLSQL